MKSEFKLLSAAEERQLSVQEKVEYFKQLREFVSQRKLQNTTIGATSVAPKLKGITNKIASSLTKVLADKNVEWISDGQQNIPNGPNIYAHTHQGILDNFVWIPELQQHCIILHGAEVNKLLLLCQLNTGLILVIKENKVNNINAKLDMIQLLTSGHSVAYFPEGTWNLSPNKLHLPLSYGFLDTACKAQVPVIPVVHEFTYDTSCEKEKITKIHSRYGKPIYVTEKDNLLDKLTEYEETISTMRFEMIEEKGIFTRSEITNRDYINYLKGNYKNLKLGKLDMDKERRNIYGAKADFYLFHHINDIPFDEKGNLLDTKEVQKLKELNRNHCI